MVYEKSQLKGTLADARLGRALDCQLGFFYEKLGYVKGAHGA